MKKSNLLRKNFVKNPLTIIACILLLLSAFVFADRNAGFDRTIHNATSHQPENFTELYFSDYSALPKLLTVGKNYPVPFTIANHESKAFAYTYQIELTEAGTKTVSKPVKVTVANDHTVQRTVYIFARQPGDHVEMVIRVLNKNLTIHYKARS